MSSSLADNWERGSPYEQYIGRWSRRVAPKFLSWLAVPAGKTWVDVGCGTGALCAAILDGCSPGAVTGVEPSEGFLNLARQTLGKRARFVAGSATALPMPVGAADVVVSGLVLNFVADARAALVEMARVAAPRSTIAAYVWDYADKMEVIRLFWDAAVSLDASAAQLHEGARFPICRPDELRAAFDAAGLVDVEVVPLDATAEFASFDDYWQPFLGGQGPAPSYLMSLPDERRSQLRETLKARVAPAGDQPISLAARAWAVRGTKRA